MKIKNTSKFTSITHRAHITNYGYLSIGKEYLNTTTDDYIDVDGKRFFIKQLKLNISYDDNNHFYRWDKAAQRKCLRDV